jgi:RNA polymerase sigma-70 factor (ECF subfamily)
MERVISSSDMGFLRRADAGATELDDVELLYRLYGAKVTRFLAFSLNDSDAAETLTQECFLKAYRTRAQFRGECAVGTWLIRIAFNLVRDHTGTEKFKFWKRVRAQAVDVHEVGERLAGRERTPEAQMLTRERLAVIWEVVETLSARQRSVFLMRFVEEMEMQEIVEATGMQMGTVKSHLHRALAAVREKAAASDALRTIGGRR